MQNLLRYTLLSLLFLLVSNASLYSQIVNGNFDLPGISSTTPCQAGTGWTTAIGSNSSQYTNSLGPVTNYWIDLTPCGNSGNGSYIEQTVPTIIGACYYLKFDLGTHYRWDMSDAGVYITIDGQPLGSRIYNDIFNGDITKIHWETRTSQIFIATGTTTRIRFTGEGRCSTTSPTSGQYKCTPVGSLAYPGVMGVDNIELLTGSTIGNSKASIDTSYQCSLSDTASIKALNIGPTATVQWSVISGTATILGTGDSINVINSRHAKILMTVSDTTSCSGYVRDTITILPTVSADVNIIDQRKCLDDTILFIGTVSPLSNLSAIKTLWLFGDGNTSTLLKDKHSYKTSGPHVVTFIVTDTLKSCTDTVTIKIKDEAFIYPPSVNIGPSDTIICSGTILELPLGISVRGSSYVWSNGSTDPRFYADKPGTYILTLTNDCGSFTDTIHIKHKNCTISFPSAFSPNADGVNDLAKLIGKSFDEISDYQLSIYNRYGNSVFTTSNVYDGWDGTHKGEAQDIGTYYYYIQYQYNDETFMLKGDITLVR